MSNEVKPKELITKEFTVMVKEGTTKDGTKKFNYYRGVKKNGDIIDVKFRQTVTGIPKTDFRVVVDVTKMNIDTKKRYPVLWISEVVAFKSMEEFFESQSIENAKKFDEFFG